MQQQRNIAYMTSRFPVVTETFILRELDALKQYPASISIYPLQKGRSDVVQPSAQQWLTRVQFTPWFSLSILRSNITCLLTQPFRYLFVWLSILWKTRTSVRYLAGAFLFFPKSVHLGWMMSKRGTDHLHAHFASHPALAAYIINHLYNIPYSFTAHGSDLHRDQTMLAEKVASARFVVAISDYNRRFIQQVCKNSRCDHVHVIHCGLDLGQPKPSPNNRERSLDQGGPATFQAQSEGNRHSYSRECPVTIVCVGTLHEVKGHAVLLQACRRLVEKGLRFHCHFVGAGPDRKSLKDLCMSLGLSGQVTFHGKLTTPEVMEIVERADVLTAPSVPSRDGRREGIPVVLMEAMSRGVPVIASRLSGIPELVQHGITGLLIEPGDDQELANYIALLAEDDRLRQRLQQAAYVKIEREFNIQTETNRLWKLMTGAELHALATSESTSLTDRSRVEDGEASPESNHVTHEVVSCHS